MKQQTNIEYITQENRRYTTEHAPVSGVFSSRLKIFFLTFLFCLIVGLIINYSRTAVYQSKAILLTSAATAVDHNSSDVDFQHVTIQKQKLLGYDLLSEILVEIKSSAKNLDSSNLTLPDIRNMLKVEDIEQTNLLSMTAEGPDPEILPVVINTWIDVYLNARALGVKNTVYDTVEQVQNELTELDTKIERARKQLDQFRKEHDISSIVREENESPATLQALMRALNEANEEVVKSKARLDAVNLAIANGQAVIPEQEQKTLSDLERRHQELTEKLAEFDKRYTRDYLALQPSLKVIPEQIEKLENEIKKKRNTGKSIVWTEASQDYYAARQVMDKIREQLVEHKKKSSSFTTLFSKHQTLMDDLESLEKIKRETQERLVKIESKQYDNFPQVDVVERASVNMQAISPDYNSGALIVLITALVLAFITVWLSEFLMQGRSDQGNFDFPLSVRFGHAQHYESIPQQRGGDVIEQQSRNGLPLVPTYKKISDDDLQLLIDNADKNTQQLILLLLSGLTLEEISDLDIEQINIDHSVVQLSGISPRSITIGKRLKTILNESVQTGFLWGQRVEISEEGLNAMLYCSVVDSGLNNLDAKLAETLRQTYIIYLVEQGIRLALLDKIVGYQSPLELASYADLSPPGEGVDVEHIQLVYPACC